MKRFALLITVIAVGIVLGIGTARAYDEDPSMLHQVQISKKSPGFVGRDLDSLTSLVKAVQLGDRKIIQRLVSSGRILIVKPGDPCLIGEEFVKLPHKYPVLITIKGHEGLWLTAREFVEVK